MCACRHPGEARHVTMLQFPFLHASLRLGVRVCLRISVHDTSLMSAAHCRHAVQELPPLPMFAVSRTTGCGCYENIQHTRQHTNKLGLVPMYVLFSDLSILSATGQLGQSLWLGPTPEFYARLTVNFTQTI